jgi:hypothetical protein
MSTIQWIPHNGLPIVQISPWVGSKAAEEQRRSHHNPHVVARRSHHRSSRHGNQLIYYKIKKN